MCIESRYKLDYLVIGKRIKKGRKMIGITQSELSSLVHVTKNQICKLETNKATTSLETLINIANALQMDINDLLVSEEVMQSEDYIDLLISNQLKEFNSREKEALLLVVNAMRACKEVK